MASHDRPFGRYLEDFTPGDVFRHWPGKTITEYDNHLFCMITMNHHPLHTNAWFAEHEAEQKRNVVVGNLVYSLVLGMSVADVSGAAIANVEVETLQHKNPVFHGDTIYAETRVVDVKESSSKPDRGIVTVESKGFNQDGAEVCYFRRRVMVWKRDAAPQRQRPYGDDVWGEWNEAAAGAVLRWGDGHRRDLPWRRTRDPWAVLVAELMLQQTQVARVVPRYHAFLDTFPTTGACAARSPGDVVRAWAGLGYNRRALNLHAAATMIERELGGAFPASIERLRRLPGVGPYTALAVLAYAFEADAAVVDTNVGRVLARFHGRRLRPAEAQRLADEALPSGHAWRWNQALMDLGATVCTARTPSCAACPLASRCAWWRVGGDDPASFSAFVSGGQSRFEGSDRQGRGRLVAALRRGSIPVAAAPAAAGWPDDGDRAERVWRGLVADGLAVVDGTTLTLP